MKRLTLLAASVLIPSVSAFGTPIFEDDFESGSLSKWGSIGNTTIVSDSQTFGTETNFLHYLGSTSLWSPALTDLPDVTTLSFRFANHSGTGTSLQVGWATTGGDLNPDGQVVKFLLRPGSIAGATGNTLSPTSVAYDQETPHELRLIYNSSDTGTLTDYYDARDLGPNTAHLYLNGEYVAALTTSATQSARTPGRFGFRAFTTGNASLDVRIDDVRLVEGAVVPEPATLSLLGLGALGLLRRRRA